MIASSAFHQLKSRFRGELIVPGDQQYDAARKVFNVTIDRKPALIARCAIADDVIQALNFARQEKLLVSVRGTGHNVAGFDVCDDGLVIDATGARLTTRSNPTALPLPAASSPSPEFPVSPSVAA